MKTQYKHIAMRCTQEQFDSVKDKIDLPFVEIYSFKDYFYLTNEYNNKKVVGNTLIKQPNTF
jgi:hypothetical protein